MKLNDQAFDALFDTTSQWEAKTFAVISKESMTQLKNLEGTFRLDTGVALKVKFISIESLQGNEEGIAKIKKYAQTGQLGGAKEDGTLLFHEDLAKHINEKQRVVVVNKATGENKETEATVESISDENYQVIKTALAKLGEAFAQPKTQKDDKIKTPEVPHQKASTARTHPLSSSAANHGVKQMEGQLNDIVTGQDQRAKEAREKEKAEQKEQQRQARKQKELRQDNLKWDIKQEGIDQDVQKHDRKKV